MNGMLPIPRENVCAAFPPSRTVGSAVLRPVSIGDVIVLASFGIDLFGPLDAAQSWLLACILSLPRAADALAPDMNYKRLKRRVKSPLKAVVDAVRLQVIDAISTFVPGRGKKRMGGCGWPLELAEFLLSEYGWTWNQALDTPCATAFALMTAARQRNGGEHAAPDYIERQKVESLRTRH